MTFRDAAIRQANGCAGLGSEFTALLLRLLAERLTEDTAVGKRLLNWSGDVTANGQSVPLRIAGALNGLVVDNVDPALAKHYPPQTTTPDGLWAAVKDALSKHEPRLNAWLDRPPQTNEVARSATLIATAAWLTDRFGLPFVLSELGASAGLNLGFDRYALRVADQVVGPDAPAVTLTPDWQGEMVPAVAPRIVSRRGVDLTPLDPAKDGTRLLAYIWPDQSDRVARMRAALQCAEAEVDADDAAGWLVKRLEAVQPPGQLHLIYHTVAWQYFPRQTQQSCQSAIEAAGAKATAAKPLAWFGMEADNEKPGAGMTLRFWPGNETWNMGRVDFHGRWIDWRPKRIANT